MKERSSKKREKKDVDVEKLKERYGEMKVDRQTTEEFIRRGVRVIFENRKTKKS